MTNYHQFLLRGGATLALICSLVSYCESDLVDILGNHGVTDPAPQTVINSTNSLGNINLDENSDRRVDNLLDGVGLAGSPFVQSSIGTPTAAYFNSNAIDTRGDLGLLVDLGAVHSLDAIQLYGYNISDGFGVYGDRTPGSFTIWTATDTNAVSTASGALLMNDLSLFSQQGGTVGMLNPSNAATFGETFLFGGASQPDEVAGRITTVTGDTVFARYVFLRDLTPIETSAADANIVGLAEVQFFGAIPEPGSFGVCCLFGLIALGRRRRRSKG
jgi:hypothetical protein